MRPTCMHRYARPSSINALQGQALHAARLPCSRLSRPIGITCLPRPHDSSTSQQAAVRRIGCTPKAMFYGQPIVGLHNRVMAAAPASRRAMLSAAISGSQDWQQLAAIVDRYGQYLTANHVTHMLTKLQQLLEGQTITTTEATQVEQLLGWLLPRSRELKAISQLGPQALGATAAAVAGLQESQRRRQQQRQRQQGLAHLQEQQPQPPGKEFQQQREQEAARRQLLQDLADAAVAKRRRLTPQALNGVLSALASLDESGLSAEETRQLLNLPRNTADGSNRQQLHLPQQRWQQPQLLNMEQRQQQAQQRQQQLPSSPGDLLATARQLGRLSPELAQEWYDRALRQAVGQGSVPAQVDQWYLSGFLARELDRAAARARESAGSSKSPSGAQLLQGLLQRYGQLMGPAHLALASHKLAELQQEGAAGAQQEVEAAAGRLFQLAITPFETADAASISSLLSSCKDLGLYNRNLVSVCLARARTLLQRRGFEKAGFTARQLGVMLHSLAVLGLKPNDNWLQLAVLAAGQLLPSCSVTELERLASALLLLRAAPPAEWTAAAEARLQQLAINIGNQEEMQGADNLRTALVACTKALALLGGRWAAGWHRQLLAAGQQQQRLSGRLSAPQGGDQLRQQLRRAVVQQQRAKPDSQRYAQQQQQQQGCSDAAPRFVVANAAGSGQQGVSAAALPSLDDIMSHALEQSDVFTNAGEDISNSQASKASLPQVSINVSDDADQTHAAAAAASSSQKGVQPHVEVAAPAAWAAEQATRWASTEGKTAQPVADLQQQLDDTQQLFGKLSEADSSSSQSKQTDNMTDIAIDFADNSSDDSLQRQRQRSVADSASVLAVLMAEVDDQEVDQTAQQAVYHELGMTKDGRLTDAGVQGSESTNGDVQAGTKHQKQSGMSLADIQAAAASIKQATEQLDKLQQQHQRQQVQVNQPGQQRPQQLLGASGLPAFTAAAKHLNGSDKASRNFLLGCLEAVDMQRQQLKQQLAEKQAMAAVAEAAKLQKRAAEVAKNPLARQFEQLQADFDRARKRAAEEKAAVKDSTIVGVVKQLVPLLDSFDAALAAQQEQEQQDDSSVLSGEQEIRRVYQSLHAQLLSILRSQGVTVIGDSNDVVGSPFDPAYLEGVMRQPAPAGYKDGDVLRVLRKGYRIGDQLVRAALVVVAYED